MRQLARVVAVWSAEPEERARWERRWRSSGFSLRSHGRWLVGRLGVSGETAECASEESLYFSEGGDQRLDASNLLAHAWGDPRGLRELPGDFSFLAVRNDELCTVRAPAGVVPWYFFRSARCVAVSSSLGDLVSGLPNAELDPWATVLYATAAALPPGQSLIRGVSVQSPGSALRFAQEPGREVFFWSDSDFEVEAPDSRTLRQHAEEMREHLLANVERSLASEGNVFTVSGGVDSSVLAAFAVNGLGRSISALTFMAPDRDVMTRDAIYVDGLLAELGARVERRWEFRLSEELRMQLLQGAPRALCLLSHPGIAALPLLAQEAPVRALIGGEFADAVVGCGLNEDMWMRSVGPRDLLSRSDLWPFAAHRAKGWMGFRLRNLVGRARITVPPALPPLFGRGFVERYAEVRAAWVRDVASDPRGHFRLRRQRAAALAAMHWEATAGAGVAVAYPFWSRGMLELLLRTHGVELMGPGSKGVLRRAAAGLTPAQNLSRLDKGHGGTRQPGWLGFGDSLPVELAAIVRTDWVPRPPGRLPATDALILRSLLNIVGALRTKSPEEVTA